jgi:hypothetical protein
MVLENANERPFDLSCKTNKKIKAEKEKKKDKIIIKGCIQAQ